MPRPPVSLRVLLAVGLLVVMATGAAPHQATNESQNKVLILDGSFVHNAGNLRLNITNWGLIGSRPSAGAPYSNAPSAIWPAGSNVDHIFAAGLWVGAIKNGVPLVSTGQYESELLPDPDDPVDTIFRINVGEPGAARYPDPAFDDDFDGEEDEDPWNGLDDDSDGLIDEDYGAIGDQHFRLKMRDDRPLASQLYPDHDPLHIEIVQESFQWSRSDVDDFVGFRFTLTNVGISTLEDVYVGFFMDGDIGLRGSGDVASDDLAGFLQESAVAPDGSLVPLQLATMFDADGDNGVAPGVIGFGFVDFPTDPSGFSAPSTLEAASYRYFNGNSPYPGGDPTNDAERYDALSSGVIQTPPAPTEGNARDYRVLISVGPFSSLEPGQPLVIDAILAVGDGVAGLRENAVAAALAAYGQSFDRDADPDTGINGRELKICEADFGPPGPGNPIFTIFQDCVTAELLQGPNPPSPIAPGDLDPDGCIYINNDCGFELSRGAGPDPDGLTICVQDELGVPESTIVGCTGIRGREYLLPWFVPNPSVPVVSGTLHGEVREQAATLVADLFFAQPQQIVVARDASDGIASRRWRGSEIATSTAASGALRLRLTDDEAGTWPRRYRLLLQTEQSEDLLDEIVLDAKPIHALSLRVSPNPSNPKALITYALPRAGSVKLEILNAQGRRVRTLSPGSKPAGEHTAIWNGRDDAGSASASGVYFVRIALDQQITVERLVLLR